MPLRMTNPYGFVIKPFRDKDVLTALDIAVYRHDHQLENGWRQTAVLQKKAAEILCFSTILGTEDPANGKNTTALYTFRVLFFRPGTGRKPKFL
jgi:hypothetical protein